MLIPCCIGSAMFFLFDLLWSKTESVLESQRLELEYMDHLNETINLWEGLSDQYSRLISRVEPRTALNIENLFTFTMNELRAASSLMQHQPEKLATIAAIKSLVMREDRTFNSLSAQRKLLIDSMRAGRVSSFDAAYVSKLLAGALQSFNEIRFAERILLQKEAADLETARALQLQSVREFTWQIVFAAAASVLLTVVLAWFVTVPVAVRVRKLSMSCESLLRGEQNANELKGDDELSYLERMLNDSFDNVRSSSEHRQSILSMVVHDIRAPLMAARANLNLMEENADGFDGDSIDQIVSVYDRLHAVMETAEHILASEGSTLPTLQQSNSMQGDVDAGHNHALNLTESKKEIIPSSLFGFSKAVLSPRLFHQILAITVCPLLIQVALIAYIETQVQKSYEFSDGMAHISELLILKHLNVLNGLMATSEQAYFVLTGDVHAREAGKALFHGGSLKG